MKKIVVAVALCLSSLPAFAQSSPNLTFGFVPTPQLWNSYFQSKQDTLGYTPLNTNGGVMLGPLVTFASSAIQSGFNIPPGTAPGSPNNGDIWATTAGLFVQVNGSTVGPLISAATPCSICALTTNPLSQFAATTSAQLRAVLSDETGTGAAVFQNGVLGTATATTINGITITASTGTLTLNTNTLAVAGSGAALTIGGVNNKTLTFNNSLTLAGTDATTMTFPSTSTTLAGLGIVQTFTAPQTFTGTTAPAAAAGNTVILGSIFTSPILSNNGQAFFYNNTNDGAIIQGDGATFDFTLANKGSSAIFTVPTGTTKLNFPSLAVGTCVNGVGLDSGNNTVLIGCPGSASAIQLGTTTIIGGVSGNVEINNAGVLGEATPGNGVGIISGTLGLTAARRTLPTKQVFLSSSGTYTTPSNVLWIEIELVGAGSGGGAGNQSASSTAGGASCWNTTGAACTTPVYSAGGGGTASNAASGSGGTISGTGTCDWQAVGGNGSGPGESTATVATSGGVGGASSHGGNGGGGEGGSTAGSAGGTNSGGGGGGGGQGTAVSAFAGAGGGAGATCHVVIGTPAGTYTYAVGAGGAGNASPGSGGGVGGAGAAGIIIVYEHYGT
jgi:hypothetical protein